MEPLPHPAALAGIQGYVRMPAMLCGFLFLSTSIYRLKTSKQKRAAERGQ
jgi:hypothetical protein